MKTTSSKTVNIEAPATDDSRPAQETSTGTTAVKPSETQASYRPLFHPAIRQDLKKAQGKDGKMYDRRYFSWPMDIVEDGKRVSIPVGRNYQAAIITGYQYAVDMYILSGRPEYLKWYTGKVVEDAFRKEHELDTDPDHLAALVPARQGR